MAICHVLLSKLPSRFNAISFANEMSLVWLLGPAEEGRQQRAVLLTPMHLQTMGIRVEPKGYPEGI
jgi:hypothetical protein